jgi:hypothetical protein
MYQRIVAFVIAAIVALVMMFSAPGISEAHKGKGNHNHKNKGHHGKVNKVNKKKKVRSGNVECKTTNVGGLTNKAYNVQACHRINA